MVFNVVEATISGIHEALAAGRVSCRGVAEAYLDRIRRLDQPLGINSVVVVNPDALRVADDLDDEYRRTGVLRPLHGVPLVVKDNFDTSDMQTAAGSVLLKDSIPPDDAYQVRKLREAGAVILAKTNMAEWAFSPFHTVSSLAGTTRNPYDLDRVPAGSSGGTAAAVTMSFAAAGLGTDTGNSIRGPSAHCCLVGFRSTMGLTSRDGIVPLSLRNDVGGPMARTVEDAARILDVIAGYDPADPITAASIARVPASYASFLDPDGLVGARIGVFRHYTDQPTTDPEVVKVFEVAVRDLEREGVEVVDPFVVPAFEKLTEEIYFRTFRRDLEAYLAARDSSPIRTVAEILASGRYLKEVEERLQGSAAAPPPACLDVYAEPRNVALRNAVLGAMDESGVDAFVYPTWSNPPRLIGDMESPAGDNSQKIPPHTGLPGFTMPMGFTHGRYPAGLQIVGRLFGEPRLIEVAYAYEQATRHRRPPELALASI